MRVDAIHVVLLDVAEVCAERLLLVGSVHSLSKLSSEHSSTLIGEELERRPGPTVVGALVESDRVVRSVWSTELKAHVRHLNDSNILQLFNTPVTLGRRP